MQPGSGTYVPSEAFTASGGERPAGGRTLLVVCPLIVLAAYALLVHLGSAASLPEHTTYYDQLASAFRQGHLYLDASPDPALLGLADPYDPAQRNGVPYLLDASLYAGRYYIYFGPVPALLLLPAKAFHPGIIGDEYLVLFFLSGIFLFECLLIYRLWRRFFTDLPPWLVAASLLAAGLVAPLTWIAARPDLYGAAIAGGQFFFLAGLYAVLDGFTGQRPSRGRLALSGVLWAAAAGSRFTLVLPIAFVVVMLELVLLAKEGGLRRFAATIPALTALAVTLGLGMMALGWYNWARFGSPLETGLKYQLAGQDLRPGHSLLFSPAYAMQNLYNYTLHPPARTGSPPFLYSAVGRTKRLWKPMPRPAFYHAQRVTGLLYTGPFLLFGLVPALDLLRKRQKPDNPQRGAPALRPLVLGLYGVFLINLGFLLAFFWAAERYLMDFLPCLLLLSILGFWQLARRTAGRRIPHMLCLAGGIGLMAVSILVGTLVVLGTLPLEHI